MKNALIAATLLLSSAAAASAGQIQNWPGLVVSAEHLACIADFDKSDSAYKDCRRPFLQMTYETIKKINEKVCEDVKMWAYAKAHIDNREENTIYFKAEETKPGVITYTDNNGKTLHRGSVSKPSDQQVEVCDFEKWSQHILANELTALYHITRN